MGGRKSKIFIGVDIVPTEDNYIEFEGGDIEYLIGAEIRQMFKDADAIILNIETPIINLENPLFHGIQVYLHQNRYFRG